MDKKLLALLACPSCKGPLIYQANAKELICRPCRLAYPIIDDIPVMLEKDTRELKLEEVEQLK